MRLNGKTGFALILIACGVLIMFDKLGFHLIGNLMGFIVPIAMMAFGYYGIKNGSKFFGWLLFVLGLVILLGKFSGIIGFLIAAGMIVFGISMLRKNGNTVES